MERNKLAAAAAVEAAAGMKGWNASDLAEVAKVDPGTASDFLSGKRWPRITTRASIEKALEWPAGSIKTIAEGGAVPGVSSSAHDDEGKRLAEQLARLTPQDQDAIRAVVRQLVEARSGPPSKPAEPTERDESDWQGVRLEETGPLRAVTDPDRP